MKMADTAEVALLWGPDLGAPRSRLADAPALWSADLRTGSVTPLPFLVTSTNFNACFAQGTPLVAASAQSDDIALLASQSCVMLLNKTPRTMSVAVGSTLRELGPYQVRFLSNDRTNAPAVRPG
jgi:hypothetical protein